MDIIPFGELKRVYSRLKNEIDAAVGGVLCGGRYILGNELESFEKEFAAYLQIPFTVGVGSGTEALHMALVCAGIGNGHEVIVVSNTAVPTVNAISLCGARVRLVDVDESYYLMNPRELEEAITPDTRAIMPVHLYGQCADMKPILDLAQMHNLTVIEDACQAHGAMCIDGRKAGTIGDYGCFSFYPSKNLGGIGDGGMIAVRDEEKYRRLLLLRNYGQIERYHHEIKGMNSRLDDIQAAVLRVKLKYLDEWNRRRNQIALYYHDNLHLPDIVLPVVAPFCSVHAFHLYVIRHPARKRLQMHLAEHGIQTLIHYPICIHRQKAYTELAEYEGRLPVSEKASFEILSLPMYPELSEREMEKVCDTVNSF